MNRNQTQFNQHDSKHYHFPRTSREAFGRALTDDDFAGEAFDTEVHKGDKAVVVVCIIIAICILFGLVG
jgi:hypothetical protein